MSLKLLRQQPTSFFVLFLLEIWERFGYYTIQSVLVVYLVRSIGYSDANAYQIFGAFTALIYGLVPVGGYLGDHILGCKRTLILGLLTLVVGYFLLALSGAQHLFSALGLVCVGNGLFKANPATLLAKSYSNGDPRMHSGFTLYYMAVNIGALLALIIGPTLTIYFGYSVAYFVGCLGILCGLINYYFLRHRLDQTIVEQKINFLQWLLILSGVGILWGSATFLLHNVVFAQSLLLLGLIGVGLIYLWYMYKMPKIERLALILIIILMIEAVFFFTLYQQMPTSLNLFAVNHVHLSLLGIKINSVSFQGLNPTWIMLCSPLLAKLYDKYKIAIPYKFALGMSLCGISFVLLFFTRYAYDANYLVSSWWLVWSYFFQSVGELLVSALGLAMVAELAPKSILGFIMGLWYLTSAVSGFSGAFVARFAALPENLTPGLDSLLIYTRTFGYIGVFTLGIACILWLTAPKLSAKMRLIAIEREKN